MRNPHFFVDFNGTNQEIRHTQFGAMRVKDAIVDYFERQGKARPNVDKDYPDVRIHVYLNKEELVVSLDLSGEALHLRGYREDTGQAPLRETLAAAIVLRSGWDKRDTISGSNVRFGYFVNRSSTDGSTNCTAITSFTLGL